MAQANPPAMLPKAMATLPESAAVAVARALAEAAAKAARKAWATLAGRARLAGLVSLVGLAKRSLCVGASPRKDRKSVV